MSDAFEAFVGALYLDQGLDVVWQFAEKVIFPYVEDDELVGVVDFKHNSKSMFIVKIVEM